jgi:hypothetical protein
VSGAPETGGCPTPCDPDCEAECHQSHDPAYRRWHQPGWSCRETQLAIAEAVAAERERILALLRQEAARLAAGTFSVAEPIGGGALTDFADALEGP